MCSPWPKVVTIRFPPEKFDEGLIHSRARPDPHVIAHQAHAHAARVEPGDMGSRDGVPRRALGVVQLPRLVPARPPTPEYRPVGRDDEVVADVAPALTHDVK